MDDTCVRSAALPVPAGADPWGMIRRHWWVVVLSAGIGLGAGAQYAALQPRVYESATSVLVTPTGAAADRRTGGLNLDTEAQLVSSTAVASKAAALLHAGPPPDTLAARVSVQVPPNTSVLVITFDAPDARSAQAGSHAFAQAYLAHRHDSAQADLTAQIAVLTAKLNQLNTAVGQVDAALAALGPAGPARANFGAQRTTIIGQIQVLTTKVNNLSTTPVDAGRIIQDAGVPAAPTRPNRTLDGGAGLLVGLVLGAAGSLVRDRLRRRIDRPGDLAGRVDVPVIATLPARMRPLEGLTEPSATVEQLFDRLRNEVVAQLPAPVATPPSQAQPPAAGGGDGPRRSRRGQTIVVSGASDGAPSAVVAANLATAFARTGAPTVLVLTHPTLMSAYLMGRSAPARTAHRSRWHPNLDIMTTDPPLSKELRDTLRTLRERAAYVVLDAPPTAASADAQSLAPLADAAITVVELRRTRYADVLDAADQLHQVGTPLLGAVVLPPGITDTAGPSHTRYDSPHDPEPPLDRPGPNRNTTTPLPALRPNR